MTGPPAEGPDLRFVDPRVIADIDDALARIGLLVESAPDAATSPPLVAIHDEARRIHAHSGCFGLAPVGAAAFMLAEYLGLLLARGERDEPAVHLYVDAMRALRRGASPAGARDILDGLERLSRRRRRRTPGGPAQAA